MKLGEKIKQLRIDAGLTQPDLSEKAAIEQSYLSKLENDKGAPSFEVISKIAAAFNIDAMTLIDSLDTSYISDNLAHLPEVAIKLEERKERQKAKFKRHYFLAATMIVLGIAFVILGNSNTIFSEKIYQYKSMGYINKGEVNSHYNAFPISEIGENRAQAETRIQKNISRIDEALMLTRNYHGENFVEEYGPKRRYFKKIFEKPSESPWRNIFTILGFVLLTSGGFGLGYVFKFNR